METHEVDFKKSTTVPCRFSECSEGCRGAFRLKKMDITKANQQLLLQTDLLTLMTIHGFVSLALRHPEIEVEADSARRIAENFVLELERIFFESKFLSREEIALINHEQNLALARVRNMTAAAAKG